MYIAYFFRRLKKLYFKDNDVIVISVICNGFDY